MPARLRCADDRVVDARSVMFATERVRRPRPTAESYLVALGCGVRERRIAQAEVMRALRSQVADAALLEVLERQQLTALVGTRLHELGALPHGLRAQVEAQLESNRMRALYYDHVGSEVLDALEDHDIPALALKGFALADAVHADAGFRRYGDIDVLVGAERLSEANAALTHLGYRDMPDGDARTGLPDLHLRARDPSGRRPLVELHWRVHWFEERFSAEMLQRSRMVDGRRRAQPADELAALLLFFARDGFVGLRLAADIAAWWDACGPSLEPLALDALADRHPALRRVWATALGVAERVVGVTATQVMTPRAHGGREPVAARLANWAALGDRDQLSSDVTLVDLLLTPPQRLPSSVRRHLLLPRAVLDRFYGLSGDQHLRRLNWRLLHPPKMLLRYMLGLVRARGASAHDPLAGSASETRTVV